MLADLYAKAIHTLLEKQNNSADVSEKLAGVLRRHGHVSLAPVIARALGREAAREDARGTVLLRTSPTLSSKERAQAKESIEKSFGSSSSITELSDGTLIGGFVAESRTKRIDGSYKRALQDLYGQIRATTH